MYSDICSCPFYDIHSSLVRKSLLVHFQLRKLPVKANSNFKTPVGNQTTGMKSYHYKGKMSDSKLQTEVTFFWAPIK